MLPTHSAHGSRRSFSRWVSEALESRRRRVVAAVIATVVVAVTAVSIFVAQHRVDRGSAAYSAGIELGTQYAGYKALTIAGPSKSPKSWCQTMVSSSDEALSGSQRRDAVAGCEVGATCYVDQTVNVTADNLLTTGPTLDLRPDCSAAGRAKAQQRDRRIAQEANGQILVFSGSELADQLREYLDQQGAQTEGDLTCEDAELASGDTDSCSVTLADGSVAHMNVTVSGEPGNVSLYVDAAR